MAKLVAEPGVPTAESGKDAPRHGSSRRETLDVPAEGGSKLIGKLAMLNLGKQESNGAISAAGGRSRGTPMGRPDWGALKDEKKAEGPSLMEQMVAEAMAAKEEKSKERRQEQLRNTKQNFGGGLKKGFLSRQTGSATSSAAQKHRSGERKKRKDGNAQDGSGMKDAMPVIRGRTAPSGGLEFDVSAGASRTAGAGFVLPEVQEAMKHSAADPLDGTGGGSGSRSDGQDWLTPELLEKISEKPRLAAMLTDPRFSKAMQLMATSPQDALGMFASSPEARESFTELMSMLSTHFTALGKAADEKTAAEEADRKKVSDGPLAQEALRRAAEGVGVAATPATSEEAAAVEDVLQQPELRELLMDPSMQRVLQECGEPQVLARYIRHPEFGPKLRRMSQAGLISFRA
ncbi:unnamed protein product [Scytosiphon promiscuus]